MSGRARRGRPVPEGFTAAMCRARGGCGEAGDSVVEPLRAAVRKSTHGVLISTGCLAGHLHCPHHEGNRVSREGIRVVVQPCARDRTPLGTALSFGPLTEAAHAEDLAAWLAVRMRQGSPPPRHLRSVRSSGSAVPRPPSPPREQ